MYFLIFLNIKAKTWKTMGKILAIVARSFASLGYLFLVLFLIVYVLALLGYNFFNDLYDQYYLTDMPRLFKKF
jgi:hypothetical protein